MLLVVHKANKLRLYAHPFLWRAIVCCPENTPKSKLLIPFNVSFVASVPNVRTGDLRIRQPFGGDLYVNTQINLNHTRMLPCKIDFVQKVDFVLAQFAYLVM